MKIKFRKTGMVILSLLILSQTTFAATYLMSITGIVKHDGSAIDSNASVVAYVGPAARPDNTGATSSTPMVFTDAGGNNITSNLQISSGAINFTGLSNQVAPGSSIYLRVWDSTERFSSTAYYEDVSYTLSGQPTENFNVAFSASGYICNYYPPAPTISINSLNPEKLSRRGLTPNFDLQLNYVITAGTDPHTYIDAYEVQVVKKASSGDTWPAWPMTKDNIIYFNNATNATPANDFYVGGQWYSLRARGTNHLGPAESDTDIGWSTPTEYQSFAGGPGGGPTIKTYTLSKEASSAGINTISVPFVTNDPVNMAISFETTPANFLPLGPGTDSKYTVGDLIGAINTKAGANIVNVFGWWDEVNQQHVGLTSIPGGDVAQAAPTGRSNPADATTAYTRQQILDMALVTDRPYQITISSPLPFTLKGYK